MFGSMRTLLSRKMARNRMPEKEEKLARISKMGGRPAQPPIPEIPKLPEFLKQKFPDHAEEIERYNEQWEKFFKRPQG